MHFAFSVVTLAALVDATAEGGESRRALQEMNSSMSMSMSISMPFMSMDFNIKGVEVSSLIPKETASAKSTVHASSKGGEKGKEAKTKKTDKKQTKGAKELNDRKLRRRALQKVNSMSMSLSMVFIIEGVEVPTFAMGKYSGIEVATFDLDESTTSTTAKIVSKGTEKMESATVHASSKEVEKEKEDKTKMTDKTQTKAAKEPKTRKLDNFSRRARVDVMSMSSPMIIMKDQLPIAKAESKAQKLAHETSGLRRALQLDILSEMSLPEMSMSMVDAIPTMLPTMMLEVGDTDPGIHIQSIHCTWQPGFAEFIERPLRACRKLDDNKHIVPYLCDGVYENVCCTVSDLANPTMQIFGTCNKADLATVRA
jgi:hypothetical protein